MVSPLYQDYHKVCVFNILRGVRVQQQVHVSSFPKPIGHPFVYCCCTPDCLPHVFGVMRHILVFNKYDSIRCTSIVEMIAQPQQMHHLPRRPTFYVYAQASHHPDTKPRFDYVCVRSKFVMRKSIQQRRLVAARQHQQIHCTAFCACRELC